MVAVRVFGAKMALDTSTLIGKQEFVTRLQQSNLNHASCQTVRLPAAEHTPYSTAQIYYKLNKFLILSCLSCDYADSMKSLTVTESQSNYQNQVTSVKVCSRDDEDEA